MWSDWIYVGMPELGDYVQARTDCGHTEEGFVRSISGNTVYLTPETGEIHQAVCWRRWTGPSSDVTVSRELELERN